MTLAVTFVAGLLMRATDPDTFSSVWSGLWWAIQTTTTVGYGDLTAAADGGKMLAVIEALSGQLYLVTVVSLVVSRLGARPRGTEGRT